MPRLGRTILPDYPHHIVQRGHNDAENKSVPIFLGVILTAWYVFDKTGSFFSALLAGLLATYVALYVSFTVTALVFSIGAGTTVFAAIAFLFVVTVITAALVALAVWLLTAELPVEMRRRLYARFDRWGTYLPTHGILVAATGERV